MSVLAQIGTSRVRMAHFFWRHTLSAGDGVVDATCGRGKDSLELCRLIAKNDFKGGGRFVGFDIQKSALEETRARLMENGIDMSLVRLYHEGHENLINRAQEDKEWFENVKLVSFNLGYLPGGDKSICTQVDTTILAVEGATKVVAPNGGIVSIIQYPHSEGREEALALKRWYKNQLDPRDWIITTMMEPSESEAQPSVVFLVRRQSSL